MLLSTISTVLTVLYLQYLLFRFILRLLIMFWMIPLSVWASIWWFGWRRRKSQQRSWTKHLHEQRISSWPFALKKLQKSNRQDLVFIRPPGISNGAFNLRMDNIWFCKILLLFQVESKTDFGMKRHSCAFVSVMEEYTGPQRPGERLILLIILIVNLCY